LNLVVHSARDIAGDDFDLGDEAVSNVNARGARALFTHAR
jgi:hypothetical protein